MKKQNFMLDAIVVGLALFSTFFGAGNLIFPPAVGLESGSAWVMGALGLLLSAIIFPVTRLVKAIGKEPVEVNEAPGFVVNKILVPMINEACDLVYTGVASVEGVDIAMKLGANHPMGPLALGDRSAWMCAWPSWTPSTTSPMTPSTAPPCLCARW